MPKSIKTSNPRSKKGAADAAPRCLDIAEKGIRTASEFARMMSAIMSDVIMGRVTPSMANATVNAGGKLLKVVELQQKYGVPVKNARKELTLAEAEGPGGIMSAGGVR